MQSLGAALAIKTMKPEVLIIGVEPENCTSFSTAMKVQGVPRNMTIARRLEGRLWYLNLFLTFSLLSTLTCMILETIIT